MNGKPTKCTAHELYIMLGTGKVKKSWYIRPMLNHTIELWSDDKCRAIINLEDKTVELKK